LGTGATGKVGIGTTKPATTLNVKGAATVRGAFGLPPQATATAAAGSISHTLNLAASVFNSEVRATGETLQKVKAQVAATQSTLGGGEVNAVSQPA